MGARHVSALRTFEDYSSEWADGHPSRIAVCAFDKPIYPRLNIFIMGLVYPVSFAALALEADHYHSVTSAPRNDLPFVQSESVPNAHNKTPQPTLACLEFTWMGSHGVIGQGRWACR